MPTAIQEASANRVDKLYAFWPAVALAPIGYGLWFGLFHLKATWDDAAITAAFARTWAQTGHIALTPISQTVEGFSSVLWFWLLSIPYFSTHHPDAGLIWMKVLSGAFFALAVWLTYAITSRELRSPAHGAAAATLFAFCTTPMREMQNGMEMNLAAVLMLLLFRALGAEKPHLSYCCLLTSLILLTRFESPFWLFIMLCGFLYARKNLRAVMTIAGATIGVFVLLELARHHIFGEWMPNTIYAKRWPPYRDWSTPLKFTCARVWATLEVLIVLPVPIFISIFYHRRQTIHPAIWVLALGCFLFGLIFGSDPGGPYGRIVEPMIPFLLIAVVALCPRRAGLAILVCAQAFTWSVQQGVLPYGNASIASIEKYGHAAESLRVKLHLDQLTVMVPDVGGSALCCEHLRIVDAAMLADSELAQKGWSDFRTRFREASPDVVWTETPWSTKAGIFKYRLLNGYTKTEVNGATLYVRNDLSVTPEKLPHRVAR